jgi:LAO/AO transport system kinase
MQSKKNNRQDLVASFLRGEFKALSRLMTLVESQKTEHNELAYSCWKDILKQKKQGKAQRIGISGPPGVGKSSFLNSILSADKDFNKKNKQVVILSIDPSSEISGGSILGDKSRMHDIAAKEHIFIRPSPSQAILGGIAPRTLELIQLCELFGVKYIFIETVGVGQSEAVVRSLCDYFILLLQPTSGDELQGMKKGVLEMADLIIVNKADGELEEKAIWLENQYRDSIRKHQKIVRHSLHHPSMQKEIDQTIVEGLQKSMQRDRSEDLSYWLEQRVKEQLWLRFKQKDRFQAVWKNTLVQMTGQKKLLHESVEDILNSLD